MRQEWTDAVFLHWRIPEAVAAAHLPAGVVPDLFDGSAWVGLIGFQLRRAGLGNGPPIPYFGDFNEINVRLYSREPDGTRGVVFLSLDASRLAPVLAARVAGIPYVWSRASFRAPAETDRITGYSVRRFRGGARSDFAVSPELDAEAADPLSVHLTARFGAHARFRGRTLYIPNTHGPWPLYRAQLVLVQDQLVRATGISVLGPPESVLFSPGVHTHFGRPRVLEYH
jgi:uncharacterized protein YqjF (DUF2071 family)